MKLKTFLILGITAAATMSQAANTLTFSASFYSQDESISTGQSSNYFLNADLGQKLLYADGTASTVTGVHADLTNIALIADSPLDSPFATDIAMTDQSAVDVNSMGAAIGLEYTMDLTSLMVTQFSLGVNLPVTSDIDTFFYKVTPKISPNVGLSVGLEGSNAQFLFGVHATYDLTEFSAGTGAASLLALDTAAIGIAQGAAKAVLDANADGDDGDEWTNLTTDTIASRSNNNWDVPGTFETDTIRYGVSFEANTKVNGYTTFVKVNVMLKDTLKADKISGQGTSPTFLNGYDLKAANEDRLKASSMGINFGVRTAIYER